MGPGAAHPPRADHAGGLRLSETCAGAGRSWSSGDSAVLRLRAATGVAEQEPATGGTEAGSEDDVQLLTTSESLELLKIRHSCAHVMAMAVKQLYPTAQCTIGPAIDYGFYYDFDMGGAVVTEQDLKAIRKEMRKIVGKDLPFICEEVSEAEAIERIDDAGEPYKKEILTDIVYKDANAPITIYHIGQKGQEDHWWDLCSGPHVDSTGKIKQDAFDLESLAGAYWRGDERNQQLLRIYGTAWENKKQLQAYGKLKEEAAKRDHRKLGQQLDLFSMQELAGPGLVFWHPKGAAVRDVIERYWKDIHLQRGYDLVCSPHVAKADLWCTSGHMDFYNENMYDQMDVEDVSYQLKPMNCPFHILMYTDGHHSYRDLPIRWAELGTVYRYERSGTMHGLFRVRGFTQDDAHIFCLPDQISMEIIGVLDLIEEMMTTFGFTKYEINLSTRPEKSVGSDAIWNTAEAALVDALESKGWAYVVDNGGGAFYGPKIDVKIQDAIGRKWQCSTVQLDFNLPERFDMSYMDADSARRRPIMIHRAIFGSIERFFGILIENYAGAFPLWLAPVQCRLLPVTDAFTDFARDVASQMRGAGIRVEVCDGERIGKLIRNAERAKTPVMCVVGEKEVESDTLSVRTRKDGDLGAIGVPQVIARMKAVVEMRRDFEGGD